MENSWRRFALEPALLLLFFGWYLTTNIIVNQMLKQTCLFTFDYSGIVCTQLDSSSLVEEVLQPYVANILMTISILNSIVPAILCLFLGQWSDKFGRKKILNCSFVSCAVSMASITIISFYSDYIAVDHGVDPWYYLFAQLPFTFFGGWTTLLILVLCSLTDQTTVENRSYRFAVVELIIFTGVLIAIASSSFLLEFTNATTVFSISFLCILSGTLIEIFFVQETVKDVKKGVKLNEQIRELFSLNYVMEIIVSFKQKRDWNKRKILWSLMMILMLINFAQSGSSPLLYLFVRQKFSWTLQDLTIFEASSMLMTMFGAVFSLIVIKKLLKFNDLTISIFAMTSALVNVIVTTVAYQSWQMYIGALLGSLKVISFPMLRSIMSTIVNENEVSKIYSLTSSVEAVSGLGAAPLYTSVYSATLSTFPSAFNLITVGIYAISVTLALFIAKWMNSKANLDTKTTKL